MTATTMPATPSVLDYQARMDQLVGLQLTDGWEIMRLALEARTLIGRTFEVRYLGNCPKGETPSVISKQGSFLGLVPLPKCKCFALQFRFEGAKVREPRIPTGRIISARLQGAP